MQKIVLAVATIGLAGCATTTDGMTSTQPGESAAMLCEAEGAQVHVGKRADAATGAAILKDSGARTLRWGPPNAAWTMDLREDRVNVRYDAAMTILDITCG